MRTWGKLIGTAAACCAVLALSTSTLSTTAAATTPVTAPAATADTASAAVPDTIGAAKLVHDGRAPVTVTIEDESVAPLAGVTTMGAAGAWA